MDPNASYAELAELLKRAEAILETLVGQEADAILGREGVMFVRSKDVLEKERLADKALRESEQRFRLLASATFEGIAITEQGRFVDTNEQLLHMLGYSREELIGKPVADLIPAEERGRVLDNIQHCRESHVEHHLICKDGRRLPVEAHGQDLDSDDRPLRITALRDMTERNRAATAAEAGNLAKKQFLANMSHEIRTPLHVIIGLGHLLRRDLTNATQQDRLDQLCANSDHLLAIINDVLDLSKIEAQHLVLDHSDFSLDDLVGKVMRLVEGRAREKGLQLTADVAAQLRGKALQGDALRLSQVLINLCDNAVKFTAQGGVRLTIDCLQMTAESVSVRFIVQDSGMGIAAEDQARLFHPFMQVDNSPTREHSGTGLGLVISQRLVALMGGTIQVTSEPGTGSTFSFELLLPWATIRPEAVAAAEVPTSDFTGQQVLLAEDHALSQEILFEMLSDLGCEVDVASDGVEAVARAQARPYDLILMDMQMPKLDGLGATRAIRALPAHHDTPIIALTANAFVEDRQRCVAAGMNGHVGKPVTPATLAAVLVQWLPGLSLPDDIEPPCDTELSRALANIPALNIGPAWRRTPAQLADYRVQLASFIETHCQDMARLSEHLAAGNEEATEVIAHQLKGIAGLIGAKRIASLAGEIMVGLKTGADKTVIKKLVAECEAELASLVLAVRSLPTRSP